MSVSHPPEPGLGARAVATALKFFSLLRDSFIEARQARIATEADLFRGRYRLSSKNDDELPVVR